MNKVENLKKVTLNFRAGTSADAMDLIPKNPEFSFIFGLATEGMTPFEYELVDKSEEEEVLLRIKKNAFNRFFEHLSPPLGDLFEGRDEIYVRARIAAVADAENREIVKAMADIADMAAHGGSGCDCGCGCGSGM
ncbi:MAG: hypothetical protein P8X90_33200 [Desulfobacterales bacterium]|jgi:hypothetical protein